jgi:hypothetical protein
MEIQSLFAVTEREEPPSGGQENQAAERWVSVMWQRGGIKKRQYGDLRADVTPRW